MSEVMRDAQNAFCALAKGKGRPCAIDAVPLFMASSLV